MWIIDPLDGTTNFLHGFPVFAVSIACQIKGRLEHAVVYDPMREEIFTATRGGGAHLENRRMRVSKARTLEGALIATGFPYRANIRYLDAYLGMLRAVTEQAAGVRRPGSAALDLAYVAAGRVDGFWEIGLSPWDTAAGTLLIQEAGGRIGTLTGGRVPAGRQHRRRQPEGVRGAAGNARSARAGGAARLSGGGGSLAFRRSLV